MCASIVVLSNCISFSLLGIKKFTMKMHQTLLCNAMLMAVNFMFYDGMKIAVNKVYVVDVAEEEQMPVFCVVKFIICVHESWLLCIRLLIPKFFEQKYHAFCVVMCDGWYVIRPNQLLDSNPVDFF